MRVVHLIDTASSGIGGPSAYVRAVAAAVVNREGIEVLVSTLDAVASAKAGRGALENWRRLYCAVRDADLLHIHGFFSGFVVAVFLLVRWHRKPYVITPHGQLDVWCLKKRRLFKRAFLAVIGRRIIRHARGIVVVTESERSEVFALTPRCTVEVVPPAIPVPPRAEAPRELVRPALRVAFLGRLDPVKRIEPLLEGIARARSGGLDLHCHVIGDGPAAYAASLRKLGAEVLGAQGVSFHGFLDGTAKTDLLSRCDVLVLSSRHENFGMAAAEAMALGLPVVLSAEVALSENVERIGAGVRLPKVTAQSIADALVRIADPALRARMGRAGAEWVRGYCSEQAVAAALAACYRRALVPVPRQPLKICIVSSIGGHLTEVRCFAPVYRECPHFFVVNSPMLLPADMVGRTQFIVHAERNWKVLWNLWEAWRILRAERPNVLLSTGAGPVVPFALVARLLGGVRIIFIESITRVEQPSLTGRLMYPLAHDFLFQWEPLARLFPRGRCCGPLI